MGRRGPPPTPTRLKVLYGNPGKRPLNRFEPKPQGATPRCPSWLDEEAKRKWRQLIPQLAAMGVLTSIDADALTNYCQIWSRWVRAEKFIQEHGDVYSIKDEAGKPRYLQQVPQVSIARNLLHVLNRLQQEFGLTPSARSSIRIENNAPDALDEFLSGRRSG